MKVSSVCISSSPALFCWTFSSEMFSHVGCKTEPEAFEISQTLRLGSQFCNLQISEPELKSRNALLIPGEILFRLFCVDCLQGGKA